MRRTSGPLKDLRFAIRIANHNRTERLVRFEALSHSVIFLTELANSLLLSEVQNKTT